MRVGSKKIYHLEAWVVKVMSIYKVGLPFKIYFVVIDVSIQALFLRHGHGDGHV